MMQRSHLWLSVVISMLVLVLTGCVNPSERDDKVTIRLGHSLDAQHSVHKAMEYMGQQLYKYSGGTMTLEIYPNSQLGSERELVELLQIGSLGMTKVSASSLEGFAPEMQIFSLPYVFRDSEHFWRVLNSEVGTDLLSGLENYRLKGMGYYDAGSRSFYTNDKPVHTPEDLKGLKIRVMNSPTAVKTVRAMGAAATPVAWGELYTALQQGVVDGAENNPPSYYLSRHYEISGYYTLDEHTSVPDVMLCSLRVWESLSAQQKQWLEQAMQDSVAYQRKLWTASTKASLEAVAKAGVTIIHPDKQPFLDAVTPLHNSYTGTPVGNMLTQIKAM